MATKKPTGLSINRDGTKYKLTWKRADKNYSRGQQLKHRSNYTNSKGEKKSTGWTSETISDTATAKSFTHAVANYYPNTTKMLTSVEFEVRGRRALYGKQILDPLTGLYKNVVVDEDWSSWATKSFAVLPPNAPTVTATLSDTYWNVTTFSWTTVYSLTDNRPFADCEYQSILVKDCTETDGSKLKWSTGNVGWKTGTTGATGSLTITEDTALISGKSYTRWIRVRSRGAAGYSTWKYGKHVYAAPYKAIIDSASANELSNGISAFIKWRSLSDASRPIDSSTVQYMIDTPLAGLVAPAGSWNDVSVLKDTSGSDAVSFIINDAIGFDECLWLQVVNKHDDDATFEVPSIPNLVKYGRLTEPDNVTVTTDPDTFEARITADNNSDVPDAFLAVYYQTATDPSKAFIIGVIPNGQTYCDVQCPDFTGETIAFGVFAVQGTYTQKTRSDGVTQYVISANMTSDVVWDGGQVPVAPTSVTATATETVGTVRLTWDWTWDAADSADISWSDHADAWESTDEPSIYRIDSIHAAAWNVSNLDVGKTWFFRVRLINETADGETVGGWSDVVTCNLAEAPLTPSVELSQAIISENDDVTISWAYVSMDGTPQRSAVIEDAGGEIGFVETAQHLTVNAAEMNWTAGTVVNIRVKVTSASGQESDWSDYVPVTIADPLSINVTTDLSTETITIDGDTQTVTALTALPLNVTVTGAGAGGTTSVFIERAEAYFMDRPDETQFNGYEGEVVALVTQTGEATIEIERDILTGSLDDGAWYKLIATVEDGFGQSASEEITFIVLWNHQALLPTADVEIDGTIAKITPIAPIGALAGDTVDIYRLSADRPELIYSGAEFGEVYVDPFPTIGYYGGYRIVFISKEGDYITATNEPAWTDYQIPFVVPYSIFDFGGDQIRVLLNQNIGSSWDKDFTETKYLGGSVQGDWNAAVSRTGTVNTYALKLQDPLTIEKVRRLATYTGIVHVRTIDGSSYAADVQVSEDYNFDTPARSFSLKITRVDPEGFDAVTLDEWTNE